MEKVSFTSVCSVIE